MASYNERALAVDSSGPFLRAVETAIVLASINIQAEDPAGLTLPTGYAPTGASDSTAKKQKLHEVRAALANAILVNPAGYVYKFARAVLSDPSSAGMSVSSSDSDIQFTVNSIFNAFAVTGNA